jgi:hypothetical protein
LSIACIRRANTPPKQKRPFHYSHPYTPPTDPRNPQTTRLAQYRIRSDINNIRTLHPII